MTLPAADLLFLAEVVHCLHNDQDFNRARAERVVQATRDNLARAVTKRGVEAVMRSVEKQLAVNQAHRFVRHRRGRPVATYLELEKIVEQFRTGSWIHDQLPTDEEREGFVE